ncbi:hypothetical protein Leryth_005128 [Lithospermum erythrorhizon]|nr:hypothetical protein Leryth_005128 [Lithospermum erythrorhizon]
MASEKYSENSRYLIVRPRNGGFLDLVKFSVLGSKTSGAKFLEFSDEGVIEEAFFNGEGETLYHRWLIIVSIIVRKIIGFFGKPMEWNGYILEYILNLLSHNGNLIGFVFNLLSGKIVWPQRGSETFISAIGHIDGRIDLFKSNIPLKIPTQSGSEDIAEKEMDIQILMDLCIMASKLAYENANVVRNVINCHWKMHFVDFYNCWNDYQKQESTQVFIMCDKPRDADLILVGFRGTEPFDADDWSTDFDYSWYDIPEVGKVHMGFLEALGFGNRMDTSTFGKLLRLQNTKVCKSDGANVTAGESTLSSSLSDTDTFGESDQSSDSDQAAEMPLSQMKEMSAYYAVKSKLKILLEEHKNAKVVVTGHSLGGALAILFPVVLVLHEETAVLQRLSGVYTYGQPRVGNRQLGQYMEAHIDQPVTKYFRVVYCNDLVPRLPYDDKGFLYKHFGACLYYDSFYLEQKVDEEPNINYFGLRFLIPVYLNAIWELFRSLIIGYLRGPEYKEGWESILLRIVGLAMPGISAHCPVDYVNSVRLGRQI